MRQINDHVVARLRDACELPDLTGTKYQLVIKIAAGGMACVYEALEMRDKALAELERAFDEGSVSLCILDVDPKMDSMRRDPRFGRMRKKIFEN